MASYLVAEVQILLSAAAVEALATAVDLERGNDFRAERIPEEGASKEPLGEEDHTERIVDRNVVNGRVVGVEAAPSGIEYWHPYLLEMDDLDRLARCYEHSWIMGDR